MYIPYWLLAALLIALAVAAGAALWQRHSMRRQMQRLNDMLDAAMDSSFAERTFDESLLSAVESRMDRYLSASAVSARNLALEKDKISHLIADISHQTKTPIANILLYAQLLAEQDLPQESRACVSALGAQAEKLNFLIASLVKLSRLETGILALHPVAAPLRPMLEEVQAQYGPEAEKSGGGAVVCRNRSHRDTRRQVECRSAGKHRGQRHQIHAGGRACHGQRHALSAVQPH